MASPVLDGSAFSAIAAVLFASVPLSDVFIVTSSSGQAGIEY
jgi:hypothetical protein